MIEFDTYHPEKGTILGKMTLYDRKMIRAVEETEYGCNILVNREWLATTTDYEVMKAIRDGKEVGLMVFNPFNYCLSSDDIRDIGEILAKTYGQGGSTSRN